MVTTEIFLASLLPVKLSPIFALALPAITYLRKWYEHKVKLVMFFPLSLLASLYVRTFFVDTLSQAKLAKIGESSY
jgi:hypothetical protein